MVKIETGSTPEVDTNTWHTGEEKEAHRKVERARFNEDWAEDVREEILNHYDIPPENVAFFPKVGGRKREIRAFSLLTYKPASESFYCDGHTNHSVLFDEIFKKFKRLGIKSVADLPDDYKKDWKLVKGFIDPYQNGFENFPSIRNTIIRKMDIKEQNGLTEEQVLELKKNPENGDIELPNWFKSI